MADEKYAREATGNMVISLLLSFVLRIVLTIYGQCQGKDVIVKYTDIDYSVFTDAAGHVVEGESPYLRSTFRYTPLLAWLLTPNILLHNVFGKVIFVICDIAAGYLIYKIVCLRGYAWRTAMYCAWTWLLNPLPMVVSSRGNAEPVLVVLILITIYFILQKKVSIAAVFYAIAVHFKIYPIIYSLPLFLLVGDETIAPEDNNEDTKAHTPTGNLVVRAVSYVTHPARLKFTLVSALTFIAVNWLFYTRYGFEFVEHTYLYHVTRTDVKHNFSVYFYMLYLTLDSPALSKVVGLLAFLPQLILTVGLGVKYYRDIAFCCFVQTFAFVIFNKVCTSQYFLWYLCLVPLILPQSRLSGSRAVSMVGAWFASQGLWLLLAYLLEFGGCNTFFFIWLSSILFFLVNIWILRNIIINHTMITAGEGSHHIPADTAKKTQ